MEFLGKTINGKYLLKEIISENPIFTRYFGHDIIAGNDVNAFVIAAPVMSRRPGDVIRFKSIAAKMKEVHHTSVIRIIEAGDFFDRAYVITEAFAGKSLAEYITKDGFFSISLEKKVSIVKCSAEALAHAHLKGVIHRAISPQFVFIDAERVLLWGFGFAHILDYPDDYAAEQLHELLDFLPPEQRGLIRRPVDERSDLYSLGVLLYVLLTGKFPFSESDFGATGFSEKVVPVREIYPDIPEVLEAIVLRLLKKEPSHRYGRAEALVYDLDQFLEGKRCFAIGQKDGVRQLNYRASLVGRKAEMERLIKIFADVRQGSGISVEVKGRAGCGKSRLIEEFKTEVEKRGGVFLEAKCHRESANTPYEALNGLFASLLKLYATSDEHTKAKIRELFAKEMTSCRKLIAKIQPGIVQVFEDTAILKNEEMEESARNAGILLARFLRSIELLGSAAVIFIDDVQWIDAASVSVISELISITERARVMVLLTSREGDESHAKLTPANAPYAASISIRLNALDALAVRGLVAEMMEESEDAVAAIADIIYQKSEGNPLYAKTVLKNIIEGGMAVFDGKIWKYTQHIDAQSIPDSLLDLLAHSARLLDETEEAVIACAAVIGKAIDYRFIARVLNIPENACVSAIEAARKLRIFKEDVPESDVIQFSHDRIMEIFLERIDPTNKKALHLKIAHALEAEEIEKEKAIFDMAHHYSEGGEFNSAVRYLYPAAVLAKDRYAYRDAARYFHKTIAMLGELGRKDDEQMIECKLELAAVDVIIGEYDEAISILDSLMPVIKQIDRRARAHLVLCQAHYRKADWKSCETHAAEGLALLGDYVPRTKNQVFFALAKEAMKHLLHLAFPFFFVRKKQGSDADHYRQIIEFYEPLGMSYALNDPLKLVWSNIHALNISERYIGASSELALSYYGVGALYISIPLFDIALKYLRKARQMNENLGNRWGLAKSLEFMGYYYEWRAEYETAIEYFEEAKRIFHELGDIKEYAMTLNGLEHCHYYRGEYARAIQINDEYYELVSRLGDEYSEGAALIYYSQYHRERGNANRAVEFVKRAADLSKSRGIWFNFCSALNELGCNELEAGNFERAIEYLEEARGPHEKHSFLKQYIVPVYVNLGQAYIDEYDARGGQVSKRDRASLMKKMLRACEVAVAKTRAWPTHHGAALRVHACAVEREGKHRIAYELFQKAKEHACRHNRPFEQLRTMVEIGNYHLKKGEASTAHAVFEEAYRLSVEIGSEQYVSRLSRLLGISVKDEKTPLERYFSKERHALLAQIGRQILEKKEARDIAETALVAVMDFVGARAGCVFVIYEGEKSFDILSSKGIERARLEELYHEIKREEKPAHRDEADPISLSHYTAFPLLRERKTLGMCLVETTFEDDNADKKDIRAIGSFLVIVAKALGSVQPVELKEQFPKELFSIATEQKVHKAIEYIKKNYTSDVSREGLAASLNINPDHLGKAFKSITGEKIGDYINRLRVEDAAKKLAESKEKIIDIAYAVGFESLSTFNRAFVKIMGISPQEYRKTKGGK